MMSLSKSLPALLTLLLFGAAGAQPTVVVSIHPYFDLTRQVAGDAARIVRILPPAASPHTFEPAPSHVRQVAQADLLIMNGGTGVDEWLLQLFEASGSGAPLVELIDEVDAQLLEDGHGHEGDQDHGHEDEAEPEASGGDPHRAHDGFVNPHIWLDPLIAVEAVRSIEDALVAVDPVNEQTYRANGNRLRSDLEALDRELQEMLAEVRGEPFVPFHNAWPYFARRYGLDLILEIEPFPGREPSPGYLVEVLETISASGAKAIFSEPQLADRAALVIAEAASLPLYLLDPVGGTGELESYQELMRHNTSVILTALGGE